MGEGGAGAGGGGGEGSNMHSAPNGGTNALHTGGNGGGDGAAAAASFAFSAEQVNVAYEATATALGEETSGLDEELLKSQKKVVREYIQLFATTLATKLAAHVQVICCCVQSCANGGCVCARLPALWRVCIAVYYV